MTLVSIHAPAWGATPFIAGYKFTITCFNPRTRVGCDVPSAWRYPHVRMFQSTHPRGVRPVGTLTAFEAVQVSIHAPAWGATRAANKAKIDQGAFQSTHPRGVRQNLPNGGSLELSVSIHAPAWGATVDEMKLAFVLALVSIHAPAWGATIDAFMPSGPPVMFQSTHPRGVRLFPCFIQ